MMQSGQREEASRIGWLHHRSEDQHQVFTEDLLAAFWFPDLRFCVVKRRLRRRDKFPFFILSPVIYRLKQKTFPIRFLAPY